MSRTSNQVGSSSPKGVPQSCHHVEQVRTPDGQLLGSWIEIEIYTVTYTACNTVTYTACNTVTYTACNTVTYTACNFCGVRYGKHNPSDEETVRRAYLEQQRRLACPGCGEEPFLG